MGDLVRIERDPQHAIATLTLNRPEARNALSTALLEELDAAYDEVLDVDDVTVVIITGEDPAFCAGLDLRELGSSGQNLKVHFAKRLWDASTPVIGAINGAAVTGGLELALACDILVASERARFADTHARVGVMPGAGASVLLGTGLGLRLATELSLTGRYLDAQDAYRFGLVNRVVKHDELMDAARGIAREIAAGDPATVKKLNRQIKDHARMTVGDALAHEAQTFAEFRRGMDPSLIEARRTSVIEHGRRHTDPK